MPQVAIAVCVPLGPDTASSRQVMSDIPSQTDRPLRHTHLQLEDAFLDGARNHKSDHVDRLVLAQPVDAVLRLSLQWHGQRS